MFRGFSNVFAFTFVQHVKTKGYRALTIVFGILCVVLPMVIMGIIANENVSATPDDFVEFPGEYEDTIVVDSKIEDVFIVDLSDDYVVDFSILNTVQEEGFSDLVYQSCEDLETAISQTTEKLHSIIIVVEKTETSYEANVIMPNDTQLTMDDLYLYENFLYRYFSLILMQKSGLDYTQILEFMTPSHSELITGEVEQEEIEGTDEELEEDIEDWHYESAMELFELFLPYMTIMILYFMILFYGQGVANNIIIEKTSKLMDMFLVTVKPAAVIMGKVLAIALSGIMQLSIWIVCIVVGFAGGTAIAKAIDPQTNMGIILLFESFGNLSGIFSPASIVLSIFVILAGFLMYCALSAIGGAIAGKPEDLGNTNVLFTMALVISFLCTLNSGVLSQVNGSGGFAWQYYVPFTAIFITPSDVLLGKISPWVAFASLGMILITTVLIVALAGKIYSMMVLYKGNPPSLKKVANMLMEKSNK